MTNTHRLYLEDTFVFLQILRMTHRAILRYEQY
jgi:hypothetical protein